MNTQISVLRLLIRVNAKISRSKFTFGVLRHYSLLQTNETLLSSIVCTNMKRA